PRLSTLFPYTTLFRSLIVGGYIKTRGFQRVDKVASLASPLRGSLEAVAKTTIGVGGFSLGSGASREREAARVTPALYHLLPSYRDRKSTRLNSSHVKI